MSLFKKAKKKYYQNLDEKNVIDNKKFWKTVKLLFFDKSVFFFYMNIAHTNKYNKKLQSPGALNIKETPGYKQK